MSQKNVSVSVTQNGKVIPGRAVPFRSATIRRCRKQLAGRFAAVLIASSSAKPTRLSTWSLPVVIFTRQRQALTTSFSLTRRQRGRQSSSRVTGSAEEQTERMNGLAIVIPLRNKRNGQKRKLFLTHTVCYIKVIQVLVLQGYRIFMLASC